MLFLRCKLVACWIETSIKISHYNPDVVVSTYNDPLRHPWVDIGNIVSKTMSTAGSSILGKVLDSSGGGLETSSAFTNYKSADAIGNPAGMLANMVAGGNAIMPSSLPIPGIKELSKFPLRSSQKSAVSGSPYRRKLRIPSLLMQRRRCRHRWSFFPACKRS
jgi:hypothetical protein